jgi:hypothetical protein
MWSIIINNFVNGIGSETGLICPSQQIWKFMGGRVMLTSAFAHRLMIHGSLGRDLNFQL